MESGTPYIQIRNTCTFNNKTEKAFFYITKGDILLLKKNKPVLMVFESLPKRDLVDFESHLVQSVTLFNKFFLYHFILLINLLTLEQLHIRPSHKVLTFKIYVIKTS